ncbi:MAG: cytochrome c biogenesis protein CcdA [archaeon]|nr:cytochrome c biogenesis protein CcdA [archaeon]
MSHNLRTSGFSSVLRSFLITLILLSTLFLIPITKAQSSVSLYYFYGEDCPQCSDITILIEELEAGYPELEVHKLEISHNTTNSELFNAFIQAYNPPAVDLPAVFISNKSLIGYELTKEKLENEIAWCVQNECPDPLSLIKGKEEDQSPLLVMLIGTALIEGINPCGFAVLIVLLASLLLVKSKRSVLCVGLAFIASVFATHSFVGFGIMEFYPVSGMSPLIRSIIILTIVSAGIINIRDFWRGKATLAIPSPLKPTLRKLASYASLPGALLLGFLATLGGLPCTGPIYLTMLDLIAETPSKTVFYLLLYNFFYALPLFVILAIIYKGASPEDIEEWRKGKRRYMKLIAGLVMLALGTAMLFGFV